MTSRIHVHVPWHFSRLHLLPPTSPLRLVVRRGGSFTSSRAHTHAGNKRGGVGAVGGEFDRRIFNAIKNKPLPSRVPYLLSRLGCDATRRDATRRTLLSRMETNYVFSVEERFSSVKASIDGGRDSSTPGRHQHVATCLQPTARSIEVWMSGEGQPLTVS